MPTDTTTSTKPIDRDSIEDNPVIEAARQRCLELIATGFEHDPPVLIDALPAVGKSSGVV